jgi:hypothetical protein
VPEECKEREELSNEKIVDVARIKLAFTYQGDKMRGEKGKREKGKRKKRKNSLHRQRVQNKPY